MTHAELLNDIVLRFSTGSARLFRMNAGMAWQGTVLNHQYGPWGNKLLLANARAIRLSPEGMPDLIGFRTLAFPSASSEIAVPVAVFCALEIKTGSGRPTREQKAFLELVQSAGGLAGIARSVEDARKIIGLT